MGRPREDAPHIPPPPRPTTTVTQAADAAREGRRAQRKLEETGGRTSSHGVTSVTKVFSTVTTVDGCPAIVSGSVDASDYGGWVKVHAAATLGGTPPAGRLTIVVDDGTGDGQGAFPNATSELDIGVSADGLVLGETAAVTAGYVADDPDADLTGVHLNLTIRSEVRT